MPPACSLSPPPPPRKGGGGLQLTKTLFDALSLDEGCKAEGLGSCVLQGLSALGFSALGLQGSGSAISGTVLLYL